MARVQLLTFTGKGHPQEEDYAAALLAFTKATRLEMTEALFDDILENPEDLPDELAYMATTIPSSWEFVDLTFLISGVTRAVAQQITRTRTASYAMQSMRVVDGMGLNVVNPFDETDHKHETFKAGALLAKANYQHLLTEGAAKEDARGLLPLNTESNLVAKYNLRNFVELVRARSSLRVQGEYSNIVDQMRVHTLSVWPWAEAFFRPPQEAAIALLEEVAHELGIETGSGPAWQIAKAIDLIRKG